MNKVRISNDRLWQHASNGENVDQWLRENVGYDNYTEWIGMTALPYRSFSFDDPKHATMFALRWV